MNTTTVDIHNSNLISTISSPQFYGDENVYLRELLQNAMDACMTRSALEWSWGTEFLELEEARSAVAALSISVQNVAWMSFTASNWSFESESALARLFMFTSMT